MLLFDRPAVSFPRAQHVHLVDQYHVVLPGDRGTMTCPVDIIQKWNGLESLMLIQDM